MKLLMFCILASYSAATLATTFFTESNLRINNGSYSLPKTVKVEVLSINSKLHEAKIKINNKVNNYQIRLLDINSTYDEDTYLYTVNVNSKVLSDGNPCSDYEYVSMDLQFSEEEDSRDPHSVAVLKAESLSVMHSYNWDVCHGELETEFINYNK